MAPNKTCSRIWQRKTFDLKSCQPPVWSHGKQWFSILNNSCPEDQCKFSKLLFSRTGSSGFLLWHLAVSWVLKIQLTASFYSLILNCVSKGLSQCNPVTVGQCDVWQFVSVTVQCDSNLDSLTVWLFDCLTVWLFDTWLCESVTLWQWIYSHRKKMAPQTAKSDSLSPAYMYIYRN